MTTERMIIQPLNVSPVPRLALREPEAAAALGVSPSWLRQKAKECRVPSILVGGNRMYPVAVLDNWLAEEVKKQEERGEDTSDLNSTGISTEGGGDS